MPIKSNTNLVYRYTDLLAVGKIKKNDKELDSNIIFYFLSLIMKSKL